MLRWSGIELAARKVDELFRMVLNKYEENYPHNPIGVLKFHLERSIKSGLNLVEAFIKLAYENGVRIELVESLRESGLEFSEAIKEAAVKLKDWGDQLKKLLEVTAEKSQGIIESFGDEALFKYYRKLTEKMIITTTPTIPNYRIVKVLGPVSGLTIRSRGLGGRLAAALESLTGGELKSLTMEFEKARIEALARMIKNAEKMGANAVIGVDFETSDLFAGVAIAFSAYGTAVVVEKLEGQQ